MRVAHAIVAAGLIGLAMPALAQQAPATPPGDTATTPPEQPLPPAPPAPAATARTLELSRVVLDTETNRIKARVKGGTLCVFPSNIELPAEKKTQEQERYDGLVARALKDRGVSLITKAADLFASESAAKGDVLLGAVMEPTAMNICSSVDGYKGTIEISVQWQLFDRAKGAVVQTATTKGTGMLPKFAVSGYEEMWDLAFVDALVKLHDQGVIRTALDGAPAAPAETAPAAAPATP
ncbi:hypothetical protein [Porphyrobacter sp. AAP82]|uniref:hypothetical protein n=1 Tax=Porphyrobacter sp. AAP82 TaxID=1248917 RepID=UPI0012DE1442|nr:hypothetical protein [Porphyrobacter sp. AAP82]